MNSSTPSGNKTTVILHDASQGRDIAWTTIAEFISDNAAAIKRPGVLKRQIERAVDRCQVFRIDLGAGGSFSLRRAPDIAETVEVFRAKLAKIGTAAAMTITDVFALWCEYSYRSSGQSAILSEFVDWYAERLGGDRKSLSAAVS